MKKIEEEAIQACKEWAGGELDDDIQEDCFMDGFFAGAKYEREELLRWRDPKEELPEGYHPVLVLYGEHRCIAVMWLEITADNRRIWTIDNTNIIILDRDILGWRPIVELPDNGEKIE